MFAPNVLPKARGLIVELGDSLLKAMGVHVVGGSGGGEGKERRGAARGEGRKGRAERDGIEDCGVEAIEMERGRRIEGRMDWSCCGEVHCCWL